MDNIADIRKAEMKTLKKFQYLEGTQLMMWNCAPVLVAIASFTTYILSDPENHVLDAQTAFVSLNLFNTLKKPLFMLPRGIVSLIQGGVSIKRIDDFLNSADVDPNNVTHQDLKNPVVMKHANLSWGLSDYNSNTLSDIRIGIKSDTFCIFLMVDGGTENSISINFLSLKPP